MKISSSHLLVMSFIALVPLFASAQEVRGRETHQQHRISQGTVSGQITAKGANRLEHRETNINATRRADLAAHGGHLTRRDYHTLNRRETNMSRHIYVDKHNRFTQPGVPPR